MKFEIIEPLALFDFEKIIAATQELIFDNKKYFLDSKNNWKGYVVWLDNHTYFNILDFLSMYNIITNKKEINEGKTIFSIELPVKFNSKKELDSGFEIEYDEYFTSKKLFKWEYHVELKMLDNLDIEFKVLIFFNNKKVCKFQNFFIPEEKYEFNLIQARKEYQEKMQRIEENRKLFKKILLHYFKKNNCNSLIYNEYIVYSSDVENWDISESLIAEDTIFERESYLKFQEIKEIIDSIK